MRLWFLAATTAAALLAGCNTKIIASCTPGDNVVCDVHHPEDLEVVIGTRWLLTTGERNGKNILLVDPATKEVKPLSDGPPAVAETETFPRCGEPPKTVGQGAFHLSAAEDGSQRLYILNRGRVERYRITVAGDEVTPTWEGCVKIPDELAPNDIASLGDKGFVLSHMYEKPRTWVTNAKLLLGIPTGGAWAWTRDAGWRFVPNSDAAFANGIQVDPKTGRIYVASMYNQGVVAVNLDGSDRQFAHIAEQNDNLSWTPDGTRIIGVGNVGLPIFGTAKCRSGGGKPCYFPFAVVSIDPKTLASEVIYENHTGDVPAGSTAILKDGTIYLGSTFSDRITIVKPKPRAN